MQHFSIEQLIKKKTNSFKNLQERKKFKFASKLKLERFKQDVVFKNGSKHAMKCIKISFD